MIKQLYEQTNRDAIRKAIRNAFILRLVVLIIIACSGGWEPAFINQENGVTDDYKYENGAMLFAQNAKSIFDVDAFARAFNTVDQSDRTGWHLDKPITNSALWYIFSCMLVWFTRTKYSIRLINIILACVSIKYIYGFAEKIWGEKVALKATQLYAYLPYPVIFSCFGYKEQLVVFCTFYLLSKSVNYRLGERATVGMLVKMLVVAVILLGVRSGISLILFALCVVIMFVPEMKDWSKMNKTRLIPLLLVIAAGVFAFTRFGGAISYKANAYLGGKSGGVDTISILMVKKITDIWKLPFSYMFSIIMPISLFKPLDSWLALVDNINIVMVPISMGCFFYLFLGKKLSGIVYYSTLFYYLIYVVTSLGIFRQYSSLLPLNLIYFSAFTINSPKSTKMVMCLGSALMTVALIGFYIL